MRAIISVRIAKDAYYDPEAIERGMELSSDDPESLHTLAGNCGTALEVLITTAIEDRIELLTKEATPDGE